MFIKFYPFIKYVQRHFSCRHARISSFGGNAGSPRSLKTPTDAQLFCCADGDAYMRRCCLLLSLSVLLRLPAINPKVCSKQSNNPRVMSLRSFLAASWLLVFLCSMVGVVIHQEFIAAITTQFATDISLLFNASTLLLRGADKGNERNRTTMFALMTDPRCLAAIPFVLHNALEKLPLSSPVVFFHSSHNAKCVEHWLNVMPALSQAEKMGRLIIRQEPHMDPNKKDIYNPSNWNNVLYKNVTFWESLYQYGNTALTIQADTLICSDSNSITSEYTPPWNVNYLGGISFVNDTLPSNETNAYHLNGGLSIRNLDWVISCLRQTKRISRAEDSVFSNCKGGGDGVSVVDAMAFSSDNGHTMCFNWQGNRRCPWAVHKPWVRSQHSGYSELVSYCPNITNLQLLQRDESQHL